MERHEERTVSITIDKTGSTPMAGLDRDATSPAWGWLGVHGGAGVSTLAASIPGGTESRSWPSTYGPAVVVLVCRTHVRGLLAALDAAQSWTAGTVGGDVLLAGVVAVADASEDLQRSQREVLTLLGGLVPHIWRIPWIPHLRVVKSPGDGDLAIHPAVSGLAHALASIRPRVTT